MIISLSGLHLFGGGNTYDGKGVGDSLLYAIGQQKSCLCSLLLNALDAAGTVETVEAGGQLVDIVIDAAGVIVTGSDTNLLGESGKLLDKLDFVNIAEKAHIHIFCLGHFKTLSCQTCNKGADTGVGILNIVNRVFAVLTESKAKVVIQSFYGDFSILKAADFSTEKVEGAPAATINLTFRTDGEVVKLDFYKVSETKYQYSKNGVPMGKISSLDYNKLIKNVKAISQDKKTS